MRGTVRSGSAVAAVLVLALAGCAVKETEDAAPSTAGSTSGPAETRVEDGPGTTAEPAPAPAPVPAPTPSADAGGTTQEPEPDLSAEDEAAKLVELGLPLPAYEQVCKASHCFNLLDARRAISVTERQRYILRVRTLAMAVAKLYEAKRIEAVAAKEVQA